MPWGQKTDWALPLHVFGLLSVQHGDALSHVGIDFQVTRQNDMDHIVSNLDSLPRISPLN